MNWDEFVKEFIPLKNGIPVERFEDSAYETFGDDLIEISKASIPNVFTVIDDGEWFGIINGRYRFNRLCYVITKNPCPENVNIYVKL